LDVFVVDAWSKLMSEGEIYISIKIHVVSLCSIVDVLACGFHCFVAFQALLHKFWNTIDGTCSSILFEHLYVHKITSPATLKP
jgi:hypothetical protein